MKTGTDISIAECRASGYAVVEHGKSPLDVKKDYRITISNPMCWTDSGKAIPGYKSDELYMEDVSVSYEDLWEKFMSKGDGIKSFCDFENCPYPSPDREPSFHDMVNLAQTISSYCGLE